MMNELAGRDLDAVNVTLAIRSPPLSICPQCLQRLDSDVSLECLLTLFLGHQAHDVEKIYCIFLLMSLATQAAVSTHSL